MLLMFEYINKKKDHFFPPLFSFTTGDGTEKRELFGPLIQMLDPWLQRTAHQRFHKTWELSKSICIAALEVWDDIEIDIDPQLFQQSWSRSLECF